MSLKFISIDSTKAVVTLDSYGQGLKIQKNNWKTIFSDIF